MLSSSLPSASQDGPGLWTGGLLHGLCWEGAAASVSRDRVPAWDGEASLRTFSEFLGGVQPDDTWEVFYLQ